MIAPAPRKPIPVTVCAATRVGSMLLPCVRRSWKPYAPAIVNSAEPSETSRWVRKPASRSRSSRSIPTAPPSAAASASRNRASSQESDGRLAASSIERLPLRLADLGDPRSGQVEQRVEPFAVERRPLGRRLHLDQPPLARHDDVEIDLGARVLLVVEVEQPFAAHDPERDGCDRVPEHAAQARPPERPRGRAERAQDRAQAVPPAGWEAAQVRQSLPPPSPPEAVTRPVGPPSQA